MVLDMLGLAQELWQLPSATIASHWSNARLYEGVDNFLCDKVAEAAAKVCSLHRTGQIGEPDLHEVLKSILKTIMDLPT